MSATKYSIIAFPNGVRTMVADLHGMPSNRDHDLAYAAMRAGVTPGSELDGIVAHAQTQAKVRGEYVDVYRENDFICTVDAHGPIDSLPNS